MKKFLTFLFVATFGLVSYAQETAEITFKTEEIDYGKIKVGSDGVRVFEFTNTGKAPLVITNVASSCGCTVPSWTKEPVAPGAKGKIEVKYDTKRVGPISKTVTVTSNAKQNPVKALRIRGEVQQ
ncbi:DUF1573 domain-containing protein [Capnocytophaga cynodegmi]|uniref:DUF1573 domain-containing protein n=1 Tax=Capnocytophaga cynodegmi TaxID=28189 RepID=A0A0B7HP90_9FLAO|nr:DUF1573 domain-containing protein [Capnocytophaga cynodegmi]ATA67605.1 DUF1573 domain-containing protein [Capnocytophaga cynodegmi]CEN33538.1 conserved exported hypothetical protein [Capnocytophaga cynodegmi]CEN36357.1 conserved exported hypothetical protein [Capnocytophaga cynodegmi]CEN39293.1 conserved exported hypothetical protein [Capnocytophaga cynodegmi]GIM51615.1 hypothetical protein CAPN004_06450 [Capnocytophaga cynodegmi]